MLHIILPVFLGELLTLLTLWTASTDKVKSCVTLSAFPAMPTSFCVFPTTCPWNLRVVAAEGYSCQKSWSLFLLFSLEFTYSFLSSSSQPLLMQSRKPSSSVMAGA